MTQGVHIDVGISGSLRREDALKLYEIAYHVPGDILELGTGEGLSASILAEAIQASGRASLVLSVDRRKEGISAAAAVLSEWGLNDSVFLVRLDVEEACRQLIAVNSRFSAVFLDYATRYDELTKTLRLLPDLLTPGGFVLVHDFNDRRNAAGQANFAVYQAVQDGLPSRMFSFCGAFGCLVLYRFDGQALQS